MSCYIALLAFDIWWTALHYPFDTQTQCDEAIAMLIEDYYVPSGYLRFEWHFDNP